jgi:hypothetical protein
MPIFRHLREMRQTQGDTFDLIHFLEKNQAYKKRLLNTKCVPHICHPFQSKGRMPYVDKKFVWPLPVRPSVFDIPTVTTLLVRILWNSA